jgi:uncharacterized protein HemX
MSDERASERDQPAVPEAPAVPHARAVPDPPADPPAETPATKAATALVASEGGKTVVLWLAAATFVIALIAYAIGRLQTHGQIEQADAAAQKAQAAAQAAKAESAAKDAVVRRLEARRLLGQAATALEERNFGIADAALSTSAELLARSRVGSSPALVELEQEMVKFRPVATEDVGVQRARVTGWIKRFDRIVPSTAP